MVMKKILMLILSILMLTGCELITPEDSAPRNIYLVSVALDYKSMTRINPLNCTLNDQAAICDEFQYIADECGYPLTSVVITQNGRNYTVRLNGDAIKTETFSEATMIKEDVLSRLHKLAAGLDRNDLLVFHYSGHGLDGTGELVLNKKDYSKDNTRNNLVMVTSEDLNQAVKDTDGIKFFVLDSCYSGVYADALTPVNPSSPFRDFFTLYSPNENIFVLTGASSEEQSWESGVYGNMTLCLLLSLGYDTVNKVPALATDKRYYSEIVSYVQKSMKNYPNGRIQHPEGAAIKDFLIYSRKRQ